MIRLKIFIESRTARECVPELLFLVRRCSGVVHAVVLRRYKQTLSYMSFVHIPYPTACVYVNVRVLVATSDRKLAEIFSNFAGAPTCEFYWCVFVIAQLALLLYL